MRVESAWLELKETVSKTFLKTVSAFANYDGGEIVFGVTDDGVPVGLADPESARLSIENAINDVIDPVPEYSLSESASEATVTLTVKPGRAKPYLCKGKAYRRSDTSTVEVDKVEYGRLVLEGSNMTFDSLASRVKQPTYETLGRHMRERLGVEEVGSDVLRTLGLVDMQGSVTNAGALLADVNEFPGIDLTRFGQASRDILDRLSLSGASVLAQFDEAAGFFSRYYIYERIEGMTRDVVERVPLDAFREAIANALVHRAWDIRANVTVGMYDDRVEVVSPGSLPTGITEEDYLSGHVSVLRNPVIAGVFFRLGYIEQFGTGVLRIRELYRNSPVKPRFNVRSSSVAIVLPVATMPNLSADEAAVWHALADGAAMTRLELDEAAGFSKDKTIRILNRLHDRGVIVRAGAGPSTRYRRA